MAVNLVKPSNGTSEPLVRVNWPVCRICYGTDGDTQNAYEKIDGSFISASYRVSFQLYDVKLNFLRDCQSTCEM